MTDLIYLMDQLVDKNGKILIPGVYDRVAKVTEEEKKLYEPIDFDIVSCVSVFFFLLSIFSFFRKIIAKIWGLRN